MTVGGEHRGQCRRCSLPIARLSGLWVVVGTGTTADGLSYCPPDPDREPVGVHRPAGVRHR